MKHARSDYNRIQDPAGLIPDGEPVFLLRGKDISAPAAVMAWATAHAENGGDLEMSRMAFEQARLMMEWQRRVARQVADLPEPQTVAKEG